MSTPKKEDPQKLSPPAETQPPLLSNGNIESEEAGPSHSFNPTLADGECEDKDLQRLRGDAIGDTLYSERFVLNTLLKLGQADEELQDDADLERDLCSLWDMTIETDVVVYLLQHDILDLFAGLITATEDKRLTEILIGILANMCNVAEAREQLAEHDDMIDVLLELTACMDSLTLEQLMRLWAVVFVKMNDDAVVAWYKHILKSDQFLENLCFILSNAASNTLILQAMETVNAILAKFAVMEVAGDLKLPSFEKVFIKSSLVEATVEAFSSLVKESVQPLKDSYETREEPKSSLKAKQTFCNIHSMLAQYEETSREAYESHGEAVLRCLKVIVKPLAEEVNLGQWLQYEQDVLESLNDILRVLPQPIDMEIAQFLLKLYYELSIWKPLKANDFEEDDSPQQDIDVEQVTALVLNTIYYLISKADKEALQQCMAVCPRKYSACILESFQSPLASESLKACQQKLKEAMVKK